MTESPARRTLRLQDLTALVVGYGLAALLMRAFWPRDGMPTLLAGAFAAVVYAWLGLAMGGPLVLLLDRRSRPSDADAFAPPRYTWAETAWLLIGGYWLGLAAFVVPSRLPVNPLLGVFPVAAAILIRVFGSWGAKGREPAPAWTHATGRAVLITWPFAWFAMIVLGRTMF